LLPTLSLLLGLFALGVIAFASRPSRPAPRSRARRCVGWLFVLVPLPLAVGLHLSGWLEPSVDRVGFVVATVVFALGALLVLPSGDEDDRRDADTDGDQPPWWPDFERDFRAYASRTPVRPGHLRGSRP
jgi:hypothetical protein